MNTRILYLFTRTPLHVGAGSSVGAVDQPVQRERHTGYPIIPGSSIKGVLRDQTRTNQPDQENILYGKSEGDTDSAGSAGIISFAEAKMILFPLRSAKGSYALATCPLALRRYSRDAGLKFPVPEEPDDMHCFSGSTVTLKQSGDDGVALEEYRFTSQGAFPEDWASHLAGVLDDAVLKGAERRFVLLSINPHKN